MKYKNIIHVLSYIVCSLYSAKFCCFLNVYSINFFVRLWIRGFYLHFSFLVLKQQTIHLYPTIFAYTHFCFPHTNTQNLALLHIKVLIVLEELKEVIYFGSVNHPLSLYQKEQPGYSTSILFIYFLYFCLFVKNNWHGTELTQGWVKDPNIKCSWKMRTVHIYAFGIHFYLMLHCI